MERRDHNQGATSARPAAEAVDTGLIGEFMEIGTEVRAELSELRSDLAELGAELRVEVSELGRDVRAETEVVRARWRRAIRVHLTPARRRRLAGAAVNVAVAAGAVVAFLTVFLR